MLGKLRQFVSSLQAGDTSILQTAQENLPGLLGSYRFIDYLLGEIQHPTIRQQLQQLRQQCMLPRWRQTLEKDKRNSQGCSGIF